jgi:hypothetical protein
MEVIKNQNGTTYPWLIDTVYSEFDAGAWLQNLVEAGICSSGAGLPGSSNSTCASSTVSSSAVASATISSSAVISPYYPTTTPSTTAAPTSTECDEEEETQTAY